MHVFKFMVGWLSTWIVGNCVIGSQAYPKPYAVLLIRIPVTLALLTLGLILGQHGTTGKVLMVALFLAAYGWLYFTNPPDFLSGWATALSMGVGAIITAVLLFMGVIRRNLGTIEPTFYHILLLTSIVILVYDLYCSLTNHLSIRRFQGSEMYCERCGWRKKHGISYAGRVINYLGGGRALATSQYSDTWRCPWHG